MSRLIMQEEQECKVTLKTPYKNIETDRYMLFAKKNGECMIEVNGLDIDEIMDFAEKLNTLIKENVKDFCEELEKGSE